MQKTVKIYPFVYLYWEDIITQQALASAVAQIRTETVY